MRDLHEPSTHGSGLQPMSREARAVAERYAKRNVSVPTNLYSPLNPAELMARQEKERALVRLIRFAGLEPVSGRTVLEIGCGIGSNLLKLLDLGFSPENLVGNELLEERATIARSRLPDGIRIFLADASSLQFPNADFDIVYQSTVFTSLLDASFQDELARKMWNWVRPGGGVLWYDFVYDNPSNADVRGVPMRRIRQLFPRATIKSWRVTLAPPISRRVTELHPSFYNLFNTLAFLRTHVLCWIQKE